MPLSEEEQRILQEMEQKLYENDRSFVDRVRAEGPRSAAARSMRWSAAVVVAGLAVLLLAFRTSLLLGTFGFVVMLCGTLIFERSARQYVGGRSSEPSGQAARPRGAGGELSIIGRRLRSRFWRER
ncbi:MAG TPA: DUF3040 domain-containing protein [Acidimicrobiales bacterium]|nr:DUF3040 domain-containing protein [Acidimicrobiales bacterium]